MPSHHVRLARQTGLLALLTLLPAHLARDRRLQALPRPGYPLAEGAVVLLQLGPLFGDFAVGDGRLPDSVIDIDSQGQQPSFNDVLLAGPAGCIQLDDHLRVQGPIGAHERDQLGLGGRGGAGGTTLLIWATFDIDIVQSELIGAIQRILMQLGAPPQLVFTTHAG